MCKLVVKEPLLNFDMIQTDKINITDYRKSGGARWEKLLRTHYTLSFI